jgi:hypothetical protein
MGEEKTVEEWVKREAIETLFREKDRTSFGRAIAQAVRRSAQV